ncbi:MAG: permease [Firmicutes bacterium HGW-Firmicutes-19]|jgi:uncharacterized membrane protein YraQ (UPF0718 family)|nr:MAG: permease [Firmicutes bacterium HGW-Firmicutes-19]
MNWFNIALYLVSVLAVGISFVKDKQKTRMAFKKAFKSLENILPAMLVILMVIGVTMAWITPEVISSLIGESSGIWGVMVASFLGSITLIPGFIAFPLAANLLKLNAGYTQMAAFISTLMMVGVVTFQMETKYLGAGLALKRNVAAFIYSVLIAFVIGGLMIWLP